MKPDVYAELPPIAKKLLAQAEQAIQPFLEKKNAPYLTVTFQRKTT